MKNIRIFIRKFSFFGSEIFNTYEQACFRNDEITQEILQSRSAGFPGTTEEEQMEAKMTRPTVRHG